MAVQRRNTKQRKLVLDAVRQSYNHPTADEIYNAVREQDDKISRGTVYRNLNLLADAGEILSIKTPGGSRFDRTIEPHAHIICTSCSRVIDVPLPFDAQLDAKASEQIGWHVTSHYTIFEGLCPDCRKMFGTCPQIYLPIRYSKQHISRHVPKTYSASRRHSSSSTVRT